MYFQTEDSSLVEVGVADIPNKKRREKFAKMVNIFYLDALDITNQKYLKVESLAGMEHEHHLLAMSIDQQ